MTYTFHFSDVGADSVGLVGGKSANLGELTRAGLPVPPGFCLTADAYRAFLTTSSASEVIGDILAGLRPDDPADVDDRSARIRDLLHLQPVPADIAAQVLERYHQLNALLGLPDAAPLAVAVRSSATAEDLPTASFAGQQDTYLNIRGDDALLEHVRRCWASLWTARAVAYRVKQGFDHQSVALAVVVQAMIPSEISGILFTANPVSGDRGEAMVNASWGLGEAVVSGLVTPDTFTVRRSDGAILTRHIGSKERMIVYSADGGTVELDVPEDRRAVPSLSDDQVAGLVLLGDRIEQHYGTPMDIEWGIAGGRHYVLQARAITTLAKPSPEPTPEAVPATGEYSRAMFVELFPDPLSPIFLSAIQWLFHLMLDFSFTTLGFRAPGDIESVGAYYCQPYFHREYVEAALAPLSPPVRQRFAAQVMNPFTAHGHGVSTEFSWPFARMLLHLGWFMIQSPRRLPRIIAQWQAETRALDELPVTTLTEVEIAGHIRRLVHEDVSRLLNLDFLMILLIGMTYRALDSLLRRAFGAESEELRARLVSGVTGNAAMEINKRLWDLAQLAKASPTVNAALRAGVRDARALVAGLPENDAFRAGLRQLLADFGHREVRMDILYPTWRDDATAPLDFIRGYLDAAESQSPHVQERRLVLEREEATRSALDRLGRDLAGRLLLRPVFRFVLKGAQDHTRERDTMHFELTRLFPPFRRMLLELGDRWAGRGLLARPGDIFFITLDELGQLTAAPRPMTDEVARRRADHESCKGRPAPVAFKDGVAEFAPGSGPSSADLSADSAGALSGIAGSPGRATGPARIIMGPDDFHHLQNGEILVAPWTTPVWTPLFAIAAGLVTEVGGVLSHGAIVAREYGIPAVMAVAGATRLLRDGDQVTVDGVKGLVLTDCMHGTATPFRTEEESHGDRG